MEIKGDITVKRTGVFERRADQGLSSTSPTGNVTISRHSAYWQAMTPDAAHNVTLPAANAADMVAGWAIVIQNLAVAAASILTVKSNDAATLHEVAAGEARRFTLITTGTQAGTWHIENITSPEDVPATRYVHTHTANIGAGADEWPAAAGGYHSISIQSGDHGRGLTPLVQFFETSGGFEIGVIPDQVKIESSTGDVTFRVPEDPSLVYAGKAVVI